ncbi:MAG: PDZ domain-containing protein [Byssovorax sp.]
MIYLLLGLLGLAAIAALNVGAVLAGQWACARLLGLSGRPFWPRSGSRSGPPVGAGKRVLLAVAGCVAAYLTAAWVLASGVYVNGVYSDDPREMRAIVMPVPGKTAALAGVRDGDRIVAVATEPIGSWRDLASAVARHAGQTVDVGIQRGDERLTLTMAVSPEGHIGVAASLETRPVGVGQSLVIGLAAPFLMLRSAEKAIFAPRSELAGPVAIVRQAAIPQERFSGLTYLGNFNGTYGLLFALSFSIVVGLRRGRDATTIEAGE